MRWAQPPPLTSTVIRMMKKVHVSITSPLPSAQRIRDFKLARNPATSLAASHPAHACAESIICTRKWTVASMPLEQRVSTGNFSD